MRFVRDHTGPFGHLQDGRRILINGEIFSRPYIIPNPEIEHRLRIRIRISSAFGIVVVTIAYILFIIFDGKGDSRHVLLISSLVGLLAGCLHSSLTRGVLRTLDRLESRITAREYCLEIANRYNIGGLLVWMATNVACIILVFELMREVQDFEIGWLLVAVLLMSLIIWTFALFAKITDQEPNGH